MPGNPNITLWRQYAAGSRTRGELTARLLSDVIELKGARILDAGCGSGGIALALHDHGARVTAIDPDVNHIQKLRAMNTGIDFIRMNIEELDSGDYQAVILNDVLEHVTDPNRVLSICRDALVPGGYLYLVTPNKYSLINLFCDPHYSLPLVSLFPRSRVRWLIAGVLKWHPLSKPDFPQLLSLSRLKTILTQNNFEFRFINRQAAELALEQPGYIWSRNWHLRTIGMINKFKLGIFFLKFINNKSGFFNNLLNPAWYILAERK